MSASRRSGHQAAAADTHFNPMPTFPYGFLDEQMSQDDKVFFKTLGKRVAERRKELGWIQAPLAEHLGISQQLIVTYESG